MCLSVGFLCHLSYLVFFEFSLSVVWWLTFIWEKFSVTVSSNASFVSLSFLFPVCICYALVVASQFLDSLFWIFFSLCFSVLEVSIGIFSSSEIVSSAMSSLLMSPSALCFVFLSLAFLFDSFLEFHLCLNCPSILVCCFF